MSAMRVAGIALFAGAGFADVAVHAVGSLQAWETPAHVATLIGMVATLAGVVSTRPGPDRCARHDKEVRNAVR